MKGIADFRLPIPDLKNSKLAIGNWQLEVS